MPVQSGSVGELSEYDWFRRTSNCPCYGCEDRQPGTGCHDRCERYKAWKGKEDEKKKARREESAVVPMSDAKRKAIWRSKRYGRSQWNTHNGTKL